MNSDNRIGGFMSEDRKPWIAVRLLLHVMIDQVCLSVCFIKGFQQQNSVGAWVFVFSSWRKPTQKKKGGEPQKNQVEVVTSYNNRNWVHGDAEWVVLGMLTVELTDWIWCKQTKRGVLEKFSLGKRVKNVCFFWFLISVRSDLPHLLILPCSTLEK